MCTFFPPEYKEHVNAAKSVKKYVIINSSGKNSLKLFYGYNASIEKNSSYAQHNE